MAQGYQDFLSKPSFTSHGNLSTAVYGPNIVGPNASILIFGAAQRMIISEVDLGFFDTVHPENVELVVSVDGLTVLQNTLSQLLTGIGSPNRGTHFTMPEYNTVRQSYVIQSSRDLLIGKSTQFIVNVGSVDSVQLQTVIYYYTVAT